MRLDSSRAPDATKPRPEVGVFGGVSSSDVSVRQSDKNTEVVLQAGGGCVTSP